MQTHTTHHRPRRGRRARRLLVALALAVAGTSAVATSGFGALSDPITANRFVLTIDQVDIATFSELSGLASEIEFADYWETSGGSVEVFKLPGKLKPPTVTLKRAMTGALDLWAWHETVRMGRMDLARRSASLTMYNAENKAVARFWLEKAWPSKLVLDGAGAARSGQPLVETATFSMEGIQRVSP